MPVAALRPFVACLLAAALAAQDDPKIEERFRVAAGFAQRGLHAEAEKEFAAFLAASPQHPLAAEARYRLGVARGEQGRGDDALAAYRDALAAGGPTFKFRTECRYRLGLTLRTAAKHAEAAAELEKAADGAGEGHYLLAAARFAAGECWRDAGKTAEAEKAFLAAAEADATPEGKYAAPALYAAGFAAFDVGAFDEAAARFAAACERAPKHEAAPECRYLAGESLLRAGKAAEALPLLEASANAKADFADDAGYALARAYAALGRADDAERAYRALVKRFADSPLAPRARLELARADYRRGKGAAAADAAAALAADEALPPEVRSAAAELRGLALLDGGKAAEAVRALEQAAAAGGAEPGRKERLALALGEALVETGDCERALASYRGAVGAADGAIAGDARYGEALALHRLGRFAEALQVLTKEIAERPDHRLAVETRFAAAENLFALKRYAEADPAYAAVPPDHALGRKAAFKRAWCAYLVDDAKAAAARFLALVPEKGKSDAAGEESLAMLALSLLKAGDDDGALAAADRYRARHKDGAHLAKSERVAARVLKKRGDLRGAAERLKAAAAAGGPGDGETASDRLVGAEIAFKQGDFAGAAAAYLPLAAEKDATGARALEGLAWCAFELGEDATAAERVAAALKHPAAAEVAPSLRELNVALALRAKRFDDAAAEARTFLKEHAGHARAAEVSYALGVALARGGKDAEAKAVFERLGDGGGLARPDLLRYELGWTRKRLGDDEGAAASFAAAAISTQDEDLGGECRVHVGERFLAQKKYAEAREILGPARGKHRPKALYRAAFAWLEEGKVEEAAAAFEELAKLDDPALVHEALALAGDCRAKLGAWKAAAAALRRVVAEAPEHERAQAARRTLGRAEVELGRPAAAVAPLEEFLRRDDGKERAESARAHLWLGRARADLKDAAAAEKAFAKATDLSDGETGAEAQFRLGLARRDAGDLNGAAEAWIKLSILYGHADWASRGLYEAGEAMEKLGRAEQARKLFAEVAEKFGTTEAAKKARAKLGQGG